MLLWVLFHNVLPPPSRSSRVFHNRPEVIACYADVSWFLLTLGIRSRQERNKERNWHWEQSHRLNAPNASFYPTSLSLVPTLFWFALRGSSAPDAKRNMTQLKIRHSSRLSSWVCLPASCSSSGVNHHHFQTQNLPAVLQAQRSKGKANPQILSESWNSSVVNSDTTGDEQNSSSRCTESLSSLQ